MIRSAINLFHLEALESKELRHLILSSSWGSKAFQKRLFRWCFRDVILSLFVLGFLSFSEQGCHDGCGGEGHGQGGSTRKGGRVGDSSLESGCISSISNSSRKSGHSTCVGYAVDCRNKIAVSTNDVEACCCG